MLSTVTALAKIRPHYTQDTQDLFRVALNSNSAVEANIAIDILSKSVPRRALITVINLRETIKCLPPSPFAMAMDEETLIKVAGLTKELAVLKKTTADNHDIIVTTAGNLVLDVIVKHAGEKYFWTPVPGGNDFMNPKLIERIIMSDHLLPEIVELIQAMGIVFNPTLYLSLDDWHLEYAQEAMAGIGDLF